MDPGGEYDRGLLRGIAKYCRLHGPWSFYGNFGISKEEMPYKKDFRADGIISRDLSDITASMKGIPAVVCSSSQEDTSQVSTISLDSRLVGDMAARHLLERGFKNFAFCGLSEKYWSAERSRSFSAKTAQAGCKAIIYKAPKHIEKSSWVREQNYMAKWLKSLPKPVGLFACNDSKAQHVMQACRMAGLKVPDEVAVLGVDNDELLCNLSNPSISSVELDFERAGYEAAQLLANLIIGKEKKNRRIVVNPVSIKTRQSTETLAIEDAEVASALRFIRDNFTKPISVVDVLDHVKLSRRSLELRFRNSLGYSINYQIRQMRVEYACRLLRETNMPVKQIAGKLGYPDTTHIARYFRTAKGMSLKAYREKFG